MTDTSKLLEKYVTRSMSVVQGYMTGLDARVIAALLSWQDDNAITGHLCEVGVHHGRLFLMLALARRAGERALAIDLFDDDVINTNTQHAGRNGALLSNATRLGINLADPEIFRTSSLDITANDILARTNGQIRFFSIDGSHLYRGVENDLRLAEQTLAPDGVIAVDDFFNPGWPDVSLASFDFLKKTSALVPFAISAKLYLCSPQMAPRYIEAINQRLRSAKIFRTQILDRETLTLKEGAKEKVRQTLHDLMARRA